LIFFRKIVSAISGYLVLYAEVAKTLLKLGLAAAGDRFTRFNKILVIERIFALLTAVLAILTFLPWRSYRIMFGDSERRHGIYSDDFAIILVGCFIAAMPLVFFLAPKVERSLNHARRWRFAGVILVLGYAFWNAVNPQRTGASKEASASWAFYCFILVVVLWSIAGFLGVRAYTPTPDQKPDKN